MAGPIKASGIEAENVEYRWNGRIPKRMISLVAGKPDQGKGLLAAHIAADVSASGERVLYSAAEDSHSLMTKPRLQAAGANLDNILLWRFQLPRHERELAQIVVDEKIDLIVMDPLAAHLSGSISRHSDNIREVLEPLTKLIESTDASVLIVEHALKRVPTSGHPLDAIGGSGSGLPAASRAAFVFGRDPDDEDRRILAPAKFNIGAWPKALAFEMDTEMVGLKNRTTGEVLEREVPLLLVDEELTAFDPMRLFETKKQPAKVGRPDDKRAAAAEWLTTYLADAGEPVKAGVIQEDAKQWGMSQKTLRRAAEDMGIVKAPPGGGRNCTWDLPDEVKDAMGLLPQDEPPADEAPINAADGSEIEISDDDLSELLGGGDQDE